MNVIKNRLIELLVEKAFKCSEKPIFNLTGGGKSNFYVNCKNVTLTAEGMFLVGSIMLPRIPPGIGYVGGPSFGADAIANAISFSSAYTTDLIDSFSIRKDLKKHGIPTLIEGNVPKGSRVAIVDDVVTTGGSTVKAISRAKICGLEVAKVIILVDRQEGGMEEIRKQCGDVLVEAIVTKEELMQNRKGWEWEQEYHGG